MSSPPFLVVERIEVAWTNRGEGGGRIVGRWRRRGGLGVDIEGGSGVGDVCGGGSRRVLERKKKLVVTNRCAYRLFRHISGSITTGWRKETTLDSRPDGCDDERQGATFLKYFSFFFLLPYALFIIFCSNYCLHFKLDHLY